MMICFGSYSDDRICSLCRETNNGEHRKCVHRKRVEETKRQRCIKEIYSACENVVEIDGCIECGIYCGDNDHIECEPLGAFCMFSHKKQKEA